MQHYKGRLCMVLSAIVVLAQFTDKIMFQSKQHFQDLFFLRVFCQMEVSKGYFKEVTNGLVNIQGEVVGPHPSP